MLAFRSFLVLIVLTVGAYTAVVVGEHGLNLLPVFFGDMAKMGWPGQFNLDFFCFLLLSGLWLAWRHEFSPLGLLLGIGGVFLGAPYLCVYLLIASFAAGGDVRVLLLGPARANA